MHNIRSSFRFILPPLVALLVAVPLVFFTFGLVHAQAATSTCDGHTGYGHCVKYTKTWTFKSHRCDPNNGQCIYACVTYKAFGWIAYNVTHPPVGNGGKETYWKNQRLFDPTLDAVAHAYDGGLCSGSVTLTSISLRQDWSGYACSFNPSLSFNYPWSVGISVSWPNCAQKNRAQHSSSCSGKGFNGHDCTQFNSGDYLKFGDHYVIVPNPADPTPPVCYGIYMHSQISNGSATNDFTGNPKEICLPA
jgi:hypothetical protein